MKDVCNKCASFTGKKHEGEYRFYRCCVYGSCPASNADGSVKGITWAESQLKENKL